MTSLTQIRDAQTSASERIERAKAALAEYVSASEDVADILREFITPPEVAHEGVAEAATNIEKAYGGRLDLGLLLQMAVRAGIQIAHESWEPADKPSQEQMLRWLGIEYDETDGVLFIPDQHIDREEW